MSQNEKVKNFETIIDVIDPSGDFESYWKTSMKEHLNDTFCSIGLMKKSTLKSLSSLSLNLRINKEESIVNEVESLFTMNIVRLIKGKVHRFILEYLKTGKTIWIFCLDVPSAFLFKTKPCGIFSRIHKNFFDVCTNFTFLVCGERFLSCNTSTLGFILHVFQ